MLKIYAGWKSHHMAILLQCRKEQPPLWNNKQEVKGRKREERTESKPSHALKWQTPHPHNLLNIVFNSAPVMSPSAFTLLSRFDPTTIGTNDKLHETSQHEHWGVTSPACSGVKMTFVPIYLKNRFLKVEWNNTQWPKAIQYKTCENLHVQYLYAINEPSFPITHCIKQIETQTYQTEKHPWCHSFKNWNPPHIFTHNNTSRSFNPLYLNFHNTQKHSEIALCGKQHCTLTAT